MADFHKKEAEENVIPHLDHSKDYAGIFASEDVVRNSSPHLFVNSEAAEQLKNENDNVAPPPPVSSSAHNEDVVVTRVSSPHLFGESEAAERLKNEIPPGYYAVEDSSSEEEEEEKEQPMEDGLAAFATYRDIMPGSTVTQQPQRNAAPPIVDPTNEGDLSHRVRMNGSSSTMIWNVVVAAMGSVGITWMLLQ